MSGKQEEQEINTRKIHKLKKTQNSYCIRSIFSCDAIHFCSGYQRLHLQSRTEDWGTFSSSLIKGTARPSETSGTATEKGTRRSTQNITIHVFTCTKTSHIKIQIFRTLTYHSAADSRYTS